MHQYKLPNSNVITLYLFTRTVYRRILKFFKQAGNLRICVLLFVKWFFLWVSQSFMSLNIRHRNCVIVLCVFFCVYWSEMLCAHCNLHTADSCIYARYVFEAWCRVYRVWDCVFWNFDPFWDQVYNKNRIIHKALILI